MDNSTHRDIETTLSLLSDLTLSEMDKIDRWFKSHNIDRSKVKTRIYKNEEYITESVAVKFMDKHLQDVQNIATKHADKYFELGINKNVNRMLNEIDRIDKDNNFFGYKLEKGKKRYYKLSELIIFFEKHLRSIDQGLSS